MIYEVDASRKVFLTLKSTSLLIAMRLLKNAARTRIIVPKCANVCEKETDWISGIGSGCVHPDYHGPKDRGRGKWEKERPNKREEGEALSGAS